MQQQTKSRKKTASIHNKQNSCSTAHAWNIGAWNRRKLHPPKLKRCAAATSPWRRFLIATAVSWDTTSRAEKNHTNSSRRLDLPEKPLLVKNVLSKYYFSNESHQMHFLLQEYKNPHCEYLLILKTTLWKTLSKGENTLKHYNIKIDVGSFNSYSTFKTPNSQLTLLKANTQLFAVWCKARLGYLRGTTSRMSFEWLTPIKSRFLIRVF